ncbi:MAG: hypothetical protein AAGA03_13755, partial [Planctomycetota bacterium]
HARADFERLQTLKGEQLVSDLKLQQAEKSLRGSEAKVDMAKSDLLLSQKGLAAKQRDHASRIARAQADIDYESAQFAKVQSEQAKVESDLEKAKLELLKVDRIVTESRAALSEPRTLRITAPISGIVTGMTDDEIVREGGTICMILPSNELESRPNAKPSNVADHVPSSFESTDVHSDTLKFSGIPGDRIASIFRPASALGRRLNSDRQQLLSAEKKLKEVQEQVVVAERELADRKLNLAKLDSVDSVATQTRQLAEASVGYRKQKLAVLREQVDELSDFIKRLKKELTAAEFKRSTSTAIVAAQVEAAEQLHQSQVSLISVLKRRVEDGVQDSESLRKAEQAAETTRAEVDQLTILRDYYQNLEKPGFGTAEDEKNSILAMLRIQVDAAERRRRIQRELTNSARTGYQSGRTPVDEVLLAEQAEAKTAAEIRQLEALLNYYTDYPSSDADSPFFEPAAMTREDNGAP